MTNHPISVIIPTYRRLQCLVRGLQSLQAQTFTEFEILVIDNAAEAAVAQAVSTFNQTARIPARYQAEPRLGLHYARHAGAYAATGAVLVYTDDDASFAPGWLRAYAQAFSMHPEMVAAGGPVRPIWESPPPTWLLEFLQDEPTRGYYSLMEPAPEFSLSLHGYFFGVNMAIRRETLCELGGFHPESFGERWLGDGESGLNAMLWERKMLIGSLPDAVAYHHIPAERMTLRYLLRRAANQGACDMYSECHHHLPSRMTLVKRAGGVLLKNKCWIRPQLYRGRTDRHGLEVQMHAARTQAHLAYLLRLSVNQQFRTMVLQTRWLDAYFKETEELFGRT